jgi:hypothetical protein
MSLKAGEQTTDLKMLVEPSFTLIISQTTERRFRLLVKNRQLSMRQCLNFAKILQ